MSNLPSNSPEWVPLAPSQFLDVAVSTALSIPAIPTSGTPPRSVPGSRLGAILLAQGVAQYYRTDGQAVTAAVTGGIQLAAGDWVFIWGYAALQQIRVIRSAGGGSVSIAYYYYREA